MENFKEILKLIVIILLFVATIFVAVITTGWLSLFVVIIGAFAIYFLTFKWL